MSASASKQKDVSVDNSRNSPVAEGNSTTHEKVSMGAFTKLGSEIKRKYYFSQTMTSQASSSGN